MFAWWDGDGMEVRLRGWAEKKVRLGGMGADGNEISGYGLGWVYYSVLQSLCVYRRVAT